jgi:hypothetical protein
MEEPDSKALHMLVRRPKPATIVKAVEQPVVKPQPEPEVFNKSIAEVAFMRPWDRIKYQAAKYDHDYALKKAQAETPQPTQEIQLKSFYDSLKTPAERMTIARYKTLSPYERLAVQAGLDIDNLPEGTDLTQMVPETMKAMAERLQRAKYGVPEPKPDATRCIQASYWD